MVELIPFLFPSWKKTVCSIRISPGSLGFLQPGKKNWFQCNHVVVRQRQGFKPTSE